MSVRRFAEIGTADEAHGNKLYPGDIRSPARVIPGGLAPARGRTRGAVRGLTSGGSHARAGAGCDGEGKHARCVSRVWGARTRLSSLAAAKKQKLVQKRTKRLAIDFTREHLSGVTAARVVG